MSAVHPACDECLKYVTQSISHPIPSSPYSKPNHKWLFGAASHDCRSKILHSLDIWTVFGYQEGIIWIGSVGGSYGYLAGKKWFMLHVYITLVQPNHRNGDGDNDYGWQRKMMMTIRGAILHQIRSFFEHCSKSLWPPAPPFVLNIMLQIFLMDFLKSA